MLEESSTQRMPTVTIVHPSLEQLVLPFLLDNTVGVHTGRRGLKSPVPLLKRILKHLEIPKRFESVHMH